MTCFTLFLLSQRPKFQCDICDKLFISSSVLHNHKKSHLPDEEVGISASSGTKADFHDLFFIEIDISLYNMR